MPINVKVYAPGFISHDAIDPNGFVTLEDDSIRAHYRKLKIPSPLWAFMLCSVNYERAGINTTLRDGDVVSFLFPIVGG